MPVLFVSRFVCLFVCVIDSVFASFIFLRVGAQSFLRPVLSTVLYAYSIDKSILFYKAAGAHGRGPELVPRARPRNPQQGQKANHRLNVFL